MKRWSSLQILSSLTIHPPPPPKTNKQNKSVFVKININNIIYSKYQVILLQAKWYSHQQHEIRVTWNTKQLRCITIFWKIAIYSAIFFHCSHIYPLIHSLVQGGKGLSNIFFFTTVLSQWICSMGNSDWFPRGKPGATESRYPTYGACWVFKCFHNPLNSDMDHRLFNVRTHVNACDCTRWCTDTVRETALKVDSGRTIPCRTGESNLRQRCAASMLYQLDYIPTIESRHKHHAEFGNLSLTNCFQDHGSLGMWKKGCVKLTLCFCFVLPIKDKALQKYNHFHKHLGEKQVQKISYWEQ